jgi:ATP-dependent helicase Lhr and Lhr-like helicase
VSHDLFPTLSDEIRSIARERGITSETAIQSQATPIILSGENALIISPTGSGKTEAALLPIFQMILEDRSKGGIRAIYVTPLRALNRDILRRIEFWGSRLGISVQVRHGDTLQKDRRKQAINPPEILITTPETLQVLLLGSRLRQGLQNLRWVVVDEIHQLATDRRGAQMSLTLERIQQLIGKDRDFQRLGLSATIANKDEVGTFLVGNNRPVKIVDASSTTKAVEYRIEMPEPTEEDRRLASELFASSQAVARMQRISDLVKSHDSTLIFVNSRTIAEFLAARLGTFGVKAGVHHGSLPREERERVEQDFKTKRIAALVCTSTLELGIDIGSIDLVIQYMSPRQVGSMIQRVGRSGHSLTRTSEGVTLSVSPEDALEAIAISKKSKEWKLEPIQIHQSALDVLCHQIAGQLLVSGRQSISQMLDIFRRSYCYRNLSKDQMLSVVNYMQTLGYLRIEPDEHVVPRSAKCRNYYLENLSMIPDERRYNVIDLSTQQKVGILGEEFMLLHAKVGVHFIVKGRVWQIESLQAENVYVTPVVDPSASIPGWDGELLPIPQGVTESVAEERGFIEKRLPDGKVSLIEETKNWNADRNVRSTIVNELELQRQNCAIPTEKQVVLEKFDRYMIVHTSKGDRINLALGELFEEILLRKGLIRHWWNDGYRIMIELTTEEFDLSEIASLLFEFDEKKRGFLSAVIRKHFPFGYYMKFIAERFGALKRGMMLSGDALKELVVKFRFTPIYEETLREALMSKVDIEGSLTFLEQCKSGKIKIKTVSSMNGPSPLGMYIFSRYAEMDENYDGSRPQNTIESMKASISNEVVSLLCFKCTNLIEYVEVGSLADPPRCTSCASSLLGVLFYGARYAKSALDKRMEGKVPLNEQESDILTKARRSADLVLSYGKQGIIAQCVYGIGPQTASKVLSKMRPKEEEFYSDLMEAKLNFIRTRQYWD